MFTSLTHPTFLFEVPNDGGSGGGAPAAVSDPPAPAVQPGVTPGQGAEQAGDDGFWGNFPNIPQEQRALLEPHLKAVQGHVTKLEQQLAPFKPFVEAGLSAEAAQGLLQFSNDFDGAPLDTWLRIGTMLQQQQLQDGTFVLDPEVDLEYLAAIARGENPEEGPVPQQQVVPGTEEIAGAEQAPVGQDPALLARIEQLEQALQRDQAQRAETVQDRLLQSRLTSMKDALTQSGWPEEAVTDELLTAQLIMNQGNVEAATKALIDQRSSLLKGFVAANTEPDDLEVELPGTQQPDRVRRPDDPFEKARGGAKGFLRRQNRAEAQNA